MGTLITKKNGSFNLKSSVSDEVRGENLTEKEVKKHFMQREIWKLLEEVIKVEMNFPNGYFINGKMVVPKKEENHMKGEKWILTNYNNSKAIYEKFIEIMKKYKLEEYFNPLVDTVWTDEDMQQYQRWVMGHPQYALLTPEQLMTQFKRLKAEGKFKTKK